MSSMAGSTSRFWSRCGRVALGVAGLGWLGCMGHCATYVATLKVVDGRSMQPLLNEGDLVLAESISTNLRLNQLFNFRKIERGDVVYVRDKRDPRTFICKRLIAFEHEVVLNNKTGQPHRVGKGQVWLEGDNSRVSEDSRDRGGFPIGLVVGRVYFKIYPEFKVVR